LNITLQLIVNALQIGAVYVVFALGLTLIFGVMKIINFAHGEFFTLTGLTISALVPYIAGISHLPNWVVYGLCFLVALVMMAVLGALAYGTIFARFNRDPVGALIVSLGLSMLMQGLFTLWFGTAPQRVPPLVPGTISLLGARISNDRIIIVVLALILTLALYLFLQKSKVGVAIRATAEDHEAATLQGIDTRRIALFGFGIGIILAAVAGALIAPTTVLTPLIGSDYLTKAFIIIIIGGAGSFWGAILGGFVVGAIESFAGFYLDQTSTLIMLLALVSLILLARPQGLLGHAAR